MPPRDPPNRPPFRSRPDLREEQDTPPDGIPTHDEIANGLREQTPVWAIFIFRRFDTFDDAMRQHAQRMGALEDIVDEHESHLSGSKANSMKAELEKKHNRDKWEERAWKIATWLIIAVLAAASRWIHFGPPSDSVPKTEVKP
jgi:hypothetical protein